MTTLTDHLAALIRAINRDIHVSYDETAVTISRSFHLHGFIRFDQIRPVEAFITANNLFATELATAIVAEFGLDKE